MCLPCMLYLVLIRSLDDGYYCLSPYWWPSHFLRILKTLHYQGWRLRSGRIRYAYEPARDRLRRRIDFTCGRQHDAHRRQSDAVLHGQQFCAPYDKEAVLSEGRSTDCDTAWVSKGPLYLVTDVVSLRLCRVLEDGGVSLCSFSVVCTWIATENYANWR